ncbi:MAG: MFS transporter [Arenicellales bacterium]|jgi:NNP family nitrate/nitrite transporter-like MFS transporter|nr:MFS transporter [Arenicellales bacterium]MDP6671949.1 MFS transporter [Arenicellales bacterium]MDP6723887.1 MFS transporter [Arenicellales bacterium]|tara:strand:- start:18212 stop:20962 length:2751 start_codon:yes stop_codon:yes gene_type:complete
MTELTKRNAESTVSQQRGMLGMSTLAFTVCFAVWTIFSIIGVTIKQDLGLNETQFGILLASPILAGSLSHVVLGICSTQYGGRVVFTITMVLTAVAVWLLSAVSTYPMFLIAGLGVGFAGGSSAIGITYVSKWYPREKQGSALAFFSVGNIGAGVTNFGAPFLLLALGWETTAQVYSVVLLITAIVFFVVTKDDPVTAARKAKGEKSSGALVELEPLKKLQVWRFAIYYFFVFGAFVSLALWLPHYLIGVYGVDIKTAGMLAALCILPAGLFRAYGHRLAVRYGARALMYAAFSVSVLCTFVLSYPEAEFVISGVKGTVSLSIGMGLGSFVATIFVLIFFMTLGMAAVDEHIPVYYPNHISPVGGLVGMIGGFGGVVLPIAFGVLADLTGVWTSSFMLLFVLVSVALVWMHFSIRSMERGALAAKPGALPALPEMQEIHGEAQVGALGPVIEDWRPDDEQFWEAKGSKIANRNLWISIVCLLLAFAIWLVWSIVVAKLPAIGFKYTMDQLFWLAALPGLSGATLRIFYAFMVPIFGGRLWTTITTASLLIPSLGIGFAVQDPETPYLVFLVLALLCGFGGGNFASSMANISFFFPTKQKGNALALNAGLGNTGVSVMQFIVPLIITASVFGMIGGEPQTTSAGTKLWLQNAGFIWVPFLIASTIAAWVGMNDIKSAKSSFKDQSIIFKRKHNWTMCWLYTGTFGSFIGYSAGFPLLAKSQFPEVDSLQFIFLGPLIGALSRAFTGWISDRIGGGRVTLWTFVLMAAAVGGVLFFIGIKDQPGAFWGFFAMFMILFFGTGVGNASTFQMIPVIMRNEIGRLMPELTGSDRVRQANKESAAIIGFTSAIAAYGAFFIPKSYGSSIALTGGPSAALWAFLIFYVTCVALTWFVYTRPGGLLHDIERGLVSTDPQEAAEK